MEQREASLDTENQIVKANPKAANSLQESREDGDLRVKEEAKPNGELLDTEGLPESQLKAKIGELQSQLDARGDLLGEHETEIVGLKMKMESQNESLKAYVEISEAVGRTEYELKARITVILELSLVISMMVSRIRRTGTGSRSRSPMASSRIPFRIILSCSSHR